MKTITLNIQDHALDRIMYFLNNIPKKDVEIITSQVPNPVTATEPKKNSIQRLKGIAKSDIKLTVEEMNEVIAMAGYNND